MKKKAVIMSVVALITLIVLSVGGYFISSGFVKRVDVGLSDFFGIRRWNRDYF